MTILYQVEDHGAILEVLRRNGSSDLRLLHLDEHCDMRGLIIDRSLGRAATTRDAPLRAGIVYGGNFLTWAVIEGLVGSVRWIYGQHGGRAEDVETLKYTTDLTALPYRIGLLRTNWRPFHLRELRYEQWRGLEDGEHLDIDWDFFATIRAPREEIASRVEEFFSRPMAERPPAIYAAYSPRYSHPSRELFETFCQELASRCDAHVVKVQEERRADGGASPIYKRALWAGKRWLRRHGVF
jgi:hypothetical protein